MKHLRALQSQTRYQDSRLRDAPQLVLKMASKWDLDIYVETLEVARSQALVFGREMRLNK